MIKKSIILLILSLFWYSVIFAENKKVCFRNILSGNTQRCEEMQGKHTSEPVYMFQDNPNADEVVQSLIENCITEIHTFIYRYENLIDKKTQDYNFGGFI